MFDGIKNTIQPSNNQINQKNINEQDDPIKKLAIEVANLVGGEIIRNEKINQNEHFELLIRNPALASEGITHIKAIKSEDLNNILEKMWQWSDNTSSKDTLLFRELEALQQIANAIGKKELVLKQGTQFVAPEQSEIYNAILNQAISIEKVDGLAKKTIIKGGSIDINATKSEVIYADEEYKYNEEELEDIKKNRADFSKTFDEDQEEFQTKFIALSSALNAQLARANKQSEPLSKEGSKEPKELKHEKELKFRVTSITENFLEVEEQQQVVEEIKKASEEVFLQDERKRGEEIKEVKAHEEKLEKSLDDNFDRIENEVKIYNLRHENDPPKRPDA